jgi:hypothetical protein
MPPLALIVNEADPPHVFLEYDPSILTAFSCHMTLFSVGCDYSLAAGASSPSGAGRAAVSTWAVYRDTFAS